MKFYRNLNYLQRQYKKHLTRVGNTYLDAG